MQNQEKKPISVRPSSFQRDRLEEINKERTKKGLKKIKYNEDGVELVRIGFEKLDIMMSIYELFCRDIDFKLASCFEELIQPSSPPFMFKSMKPLSKSMLVHHIADTIRIKNLIQKRANLKKSASFSIYSLIASKNSSSEETAIIDFNPKISKSGLVFLETLCSLEINSKKDKSPSTKAKPTKKLNPTTYRFPDEIYIKLVDLSKALNVGISVVVKMLLDLALTSKEQIAKALNQEFILNQNNVNNFIHNNPEKNSFYIQLKELVDSIPITYTNENTKKHSSKKSAPKTNA